MRRGRTPGVLAPNPFVAFADLTIALAFIFALCTFALSKTLSDVTRNERQETTQAGVGTLLRARFPGATSQTAKWVRAPADRDRNVVFARDGTVVGRISANGSYQRIELSRAFDFGGAAPNDTQSMVELGNVIRDAYARGDIAYVFLHAIVEEKEAQRAGMDDRELARERVNAVYALWHTNGIISDTSGVADGRIDPQFVVVYGKEGLYRNAEDQPGNPNSVPGRVDVVLFFTDQAERRGGPGERLP